MSTAMPTETFEITGAHVRGKRRIGVKGWESMNYSRELRELILETIQPQVDRRRIEKQDVLGSVTVDTDTGEVVEWKVDDRYLKDSN